MRFENLSSCLKPNKISNPKWLKEQKRHGLDGFAGLEEELDDKLDPLSQHQQNQKKNNLNRGRST